MGPAISFIYQHIAIDSEVQSLTCNLVVVTWIATQQLLWLLELYVSWVLVFVI